MSNNLSQTIQNHFNQQEIKKNFDLIAQKYFLDEQKRNGFLKVFELVKKGEFDVDDLYDFMNEWLGITDIKLALKIDQELFDQVYGDVYDELQELYEANKKQRIEEMENRKKESGGLNNDLNTDMESNSDELGMKYNNWTHSSLWQNILAAEENLKSKFLVNNVLDEKNIKEEFYEALNGSDKIKVVATLRVLAGAGKLGASFGGDKRYIDFWGSFLERHYGAEIKEKFAKDSVNKKYFIEFLRFVLEKRLNFKAEESAMIGMGLSALCGGAGESALGEMAYGEPENERFVWNE